MTLTSFTIDWNYIKAIASFSSTDEHRPSLCGVHIEHKDKHAVLVATDGRCLGAYKAEVTPHGYHKPFSFTLPAELLKRVRVYRDARDVKFTVELCNSRQLITLETGDSFAIRYPATEQKFPSWRQCVPITKYVQQIESVYFHPIFIENFHKAQKILSTVSGIRFWQQPKSPETPYIIDIGNKDFTGVLMPMRVVGREISKEDSYTICSYITNPET